MVGEMLIVDEVRLIKLQMYNTVIHGSEHTFCTTRERAYSSHKLIQFIAQACGKVCGHHELLV
jgi:hypothetical protein